MYNVHLKRVPFGTDEESDSSGSSSLTRDRKSVKRGTGSHNMLDNGIIPLDFFNIVENKAPSPHT